MMDSNSLLATTTAARPRATDDESVCGAFLFSTGRLKRKSPEEMARIRKLARMVTFGLNALSFLLMVWGVHRLFNLSGEDAAYGDGCGCPPAMLSTFRDLVNQKDFADAQQAEKNASALQCTLNYSHTSFGGNPGSKPSWCTASADSSSGETMKDDGQACTGPVWDPSRWYDGSGSSHQGHFVPDGSCKGVCAPQIGSSGYTCVLGDYNSSPESDGWLLWGNSCVCLTFLLTLVLLMSHRGSFPSVWKLAIIFIMSGGVGLIYSTTPGSWIMEFEPILGPFLIMGIPAFMLFGLWSSLNGLMLYLFSSSGMLTGFSANTVTLNADWFRMIVPVIACVAVEVTLVLQLRGGAGGQQGVVARLSRGALVQPKVSGHEMGRVGSFLGFVGLLSIFNLISSTGSVWWKFGSVYQYVDCSDFTNAQLQGMTTLDWSYCTEYPRPMTCGGLPAGYCLASPDRCWNDICGSGSNPRITTDTSTAATFNTGMATVSDPLLASVRHSLWCYKVGLFFFTVSAIAATMAATPNPEPTRHTQQGWRVFAVGKVTWTKPLMAVGVTSLLAALLMGIGAHGMFNLSIDDVLYGDAAGGRPPLGPLLDIFSMTGGLPGGTAKILDWHVFVDYDDLQQATAFNQSLHTQSDLRSKSDGSACEHGNVCKSGICASTTNVNSGPKQCVLQDQAKDDADAQLVYLEGLISQPFWKPVYCSLILAVCGLVPAEWDGKRVIGPRPALIMGTASLVFSLRAWVSWTSPPGDINHHGKASTFRGWYNSLIDCSDFDRKTINAAKTFDGGYSYTYDCQYSSCVKYFCYDGPSHNATEYYLRSDGTSPNSMVSTLTGIRTPSSRNPVLASWVHYCTCYLVGLSFSLIASLASIAFAFPITWRAFKTAADLVCCWGRCTGTVQIASDGGSGSANDNASMSANSVVLKPMAPMAVPTFTVAPMPPSEPALASRGETAVELDPTEARRQLVEIYTQKDQRKLANIEALLSEWKGREAALLSNVRAKHGIGDIVMQPMQPTQPTQPMQPMDGVYTPPLLEQREVGETGVSKTDPPLIVF
eukprot:COSAG01_NODE_5247_length_4386_cov_93.827152_1_plen_1051_part_00